MREEALRFESLVGAALLKWVHYQQDTQGRDIELRYFRDRDGREVDFVVTEYRRPIWLIECKWRSGSVDKSLRYLKRRFPEAKAWQIAFEGERDFVDPDGIRVMPAAAFLAELV